MLEQMNLEEIKGSITIESKHVSFDDQEDNNYKHIGAYQVAID